MLDVTMFGNRLVPALRRHLGVVIVKIAEIPMVEII